MARLARTARLEPRIFCFEIAVVVRFRILLQPIVSRACDGGNIHRPARCTQFACKTVRSLRTNASSRVESD
jgi:hypothetical protein